MDFKQATDIATDGITLGRIGEALGINWIRQSRLNAEASSYRTPPPHWPRVLLKLARERAKELEELAMVLEGMDEG